MEAAVTTHSTAPSVNIDPGTPDTRDISQNDASIGKTALAPLTSASSTSLTPSARIATALNKISETIQSPTTALAPAETGSVLVTDEKTGQTHELSLEELRHEYEDETVDRFLRVFARQVREVQMPQELPPDIPGKDDAVQHDISIPGKDGVALDDEDIGEEWRVEPEPATTIPGKIVQSLQSPVAAVSNAASTVADTTTQAAQTVKENSNHTYVLLNQGQWHGRSPADYIAMEWLAPYLPRPHRKTYQFTFGGMQSTVSRLYLACQPLYAPFMASMQALMMWEDPRKSFVYCALFWVLWFFDMLLPALFARLTFALVRRKVLPYPTAQELVERRNASTQADVMGAEIRAYLDSNTAAGVGLKDAWRMFRLATKNKKQKAKEVVEDTPHKRTDAEWREDENSKRAMLAVMEEIADFHERFANLCHWRDPDVSTRYAIILGVMILVSLFTPAKYAVKGAYAAAGIGFWFAPKIYLALPLEHRSRIPPPLGDVPTDAEYAMGIISRRVERGEQVLPPELRKKDKNSRNIANGNASKSTYSLSPSTTFNKSSTTLGIQDDDGDNVTGDHAADQSKTKKFKAKVKGAIFADQAKRQGSLADNGELLPEETFPAKYHATMGMLSLTPTNLLFYPMMSSNAKVSIPISLIRGVKKAGRMGGLKIKYVVPVEGSAASPRQSMDNASTLTNGDARSVNGIAGNGEPLEKEEKFGWVSGRDEIFAKLVGWGGRRWVKM